MGCLSVLSPESCSFKQIVALFPKRRSFRAKREIYTLTPRKTSCNLSFRAKREIFVSLSITPARFLLTSFVETTGCGVFIEMTGCATSGRTGFTRGGIRRSCARRSCATPSRTCFTQEATRNDVLDTGCATPGRACFTRESIVTMLL